MTDSPAIVQSAQIMCCPLVSECFHWAGDYFTCCDLNCLQIFIWQIWQIHSIKWAMSGLTGRICSPQKKTTYKPADVFKWSLTGPLPQQTGRQTCCHHHSTHSSSTSLSTFGVSQGFPWFMSVDEIRGRQSIRPLFSLTLSLVCVAQSDTPAGLPMKVPAHDQSPRGCRKETKGYFLSLSMGRACTSFLWGHKSVLMHMLMV